VSEAVKRNARSRRATPRAKPPTYVPRAPIERSGCGLALNVGVMSMPRAWRTREIVTITTTHVTQPPEPDRRK
jgi:hypothetical protein